MSGNNPFAQWGAYSGSFISADNQQTVFLPTSIYGALPSGSSTGYGLPMPMGLGSPGTASDATNCNSPSAATGPMQITSFHFTSPTSSILNSSVQGPGKHKFFSIATHGVGHTILIDEQAGPSKGEAVGRVEWQQTPAIVSLMGAVARQTSGQWLSWSHDRRYRVMSARGQEYSWIFNTGMFFVRHFHFSAQACINDMRFDMLITCYFTALHLWK